MADDGGSLGIIIYRLGLRWWSVWPQKVMAEAGPNGRS